MARTLHPKLKIFDSSNPEKEVTNFTAVPTFFVDDLIRMGNGIPSSFWKLTFVLLRHVLSVEKIGDKFVHTYTWKSTFEDFKEKHDIGDLAVQDWTNAYSCSGFFHVTRGSRKHPQDPNGLPTVWKYNVNATQRDWMAFVIALSKTLNPTPPEKRMARHGWACIGHSKGEPHTRSCLDCSQPYKLLLAINVDKARANSVGIPPLPPVNQGRIEEFIRRGYGVRLADGSIEWSYVKPRTPEDDVMEKMDRDESRWGS